MDWPELSLKLSQFPANCFLRGFRADQLANLFKSNTAICTYYSPQLSSFPIVEKRRSSRSRLRLCSSIFLPLLVNSTYSSFWNVFFNDNLCCQNAFAVSSNNFFLFETKLNEPFYVFKREKYNNEKKMYCVPQKSFSWVHIRSPTNSGPESNALGTKALYWTYMQ